MPSGGVVLSLAAHRGGPAQNRLALSWGPPRGAWASLHPYFKTAVLVLETHLIFSPPENGILTPLAEKQRFLLLSLRP